MKLLAHTVHKAYESDYREQLLVDHLLQVAKMSSGFAEDFGTDGRAAAWSELAGILHDIGKAKPEFQDYIRTPGSNKHVEHSSTGAKYLWDQSTANGLFWLAYCIAGHHSGLPDGGNKIDTIDDATLSAKIQRETKSGFDPVVILKQLSLPSFPMNTIPPIDNTPDVKHLGFSLSFFIRMIFSCLVDADFLDTEAFMSNPKIERLKPVDLHILEEKLDRYIDEHFRESRGPMDHKRTQIREACVAAADQQPGLFTLTVPTGGGKTISSLKFALKHARKHNKKRIIYVIPYTSIIDQTVSIFSDILGAENVLAHHSMVEYDDQDEEMDKLRLATENWDASIVVTTNVQFFESIFGNRTSKCRKLHNIANSVLIFDEAQMFPLPFLKPCIAAISELVAVYSCSAVLCTATQPALNAFFPDSLRPREIMSDPTGLYSAFRRVTYRFEGNISEDVLVQQLVKWKQVLCIVNTRKRAQDIYMKLESLEPEGKYHLSTLLYPEHRQRALHEIRDRLQKGLPCCVISTSLVEAGVDVDFPQVYRELAGLDSIIQAGGRCNREGKNKTETSIVTVFEFEAGKLPSDLRQSSEIARMICTDPDVADISNLQSIGRYFSYLYSVKGESLDQSHIISALDGGLKSRSFPFATVAKAFHIIEQNTKAVIIPDPKIQTEIQQLRKGFRNRKQMRKISLYSVGIYEYMYKDLQMLGCLEAIDDEQSILQDLSIYDEKLGLQMREGGQGVFA